MKLEHIITLADEGVKLRFLAMERSLRSVGSNLPMLVIPYSDKRFLLPKNATWWEKPEILKYLASNRAHPAMRKYQCLTLSNYQFVDADVCFLRNPETVLLPHKGFITSCTHWHNVGHTTTNEVIKLLKEKTTTWQRLVFNSGQFACDSALFEVSHLIEVASSDKYRETCLAFPHHEQPGMNLLVNYTDIEISNLTLPPYNHESSWAGDYNEEYKQYWKDPNKTPYLIHWAGIEMEIPRPINEIFLSYLTNAEKEEWNEIVRAAASRRNREKRSIRRIVKNVANGIRLGYLSPIK